MRGHGEGRMANWVVGLLVAGVIAVGSYLAYTKELPWGKGFEVTATFANGNNIRPTAPVRIAGVNVGEVTEVESVAVEGEPGEVGAVVTMELNEEALPLREDTLMKIRPRLFLEGNYFVDVSAGSPSAPEVEDGHEFPVNQTSSSVPIDTIFTTLQTDVRADLQTLLDQFGNALIRHGGAEGFRELYRTSPKANRYSAVVSEALLGTEEGDLSGTLRGLSRILRGLSRNEQTLQSFVTNFRVFSGSFAAQDQALGEAIELLPDVLEQADPVFTNLNASFPGLRAFAREALPGTRTAPEALRAATPFIRQIRKLVARDELRGLVARLRPTVPELAKLAQRNTRFLTQTRALSSCFNEVVIPWSNSTVNPVDLPGVNPYPHDPTGRTFEENGFALTGSGGESRSGDANGQTLRVLGGGGANLIRTPGPLGGTVSGLTPFPILGAMPRIQDSAKTVFRPNEPCEEQDPPDLSAGSAPEPPDQQPVTASGIDALSGPGAVRLRESAELLNRLGGIDEMPAEQADQLARAAQRTLNTLQLSNPEVNEYLAGYMRKRR